MQREVSLQCTMSFFNKDKTGFTLIELFIAISIFAVVAIALYSTFFAGISIWKRSAEGGDVYQNIRFILDDMTKDLKNSVYMYSNEEGSIYAFSGTDEEISFITLEDVTSEEETSRRELVKAAYRFDKTEDSLIRAKADKSMGFDIEKAEEEIVLKDIEDFKFEYCYETDSDIEPYEWKEEWEEDKKKIPRGVRVSFHSMAERERRPVKFTKTIFILTGVLGEEEVGL